MRKLVFLPLLTLALACGDGNPLQPDDQASLTPEQPDLMVSQAPGQNAKWSFHAVADNPAFQGLDDAWTTPSGVDHYSGYVNRFDIWGDLVGYWWFQGDVHLNTRNGKARTISRPVLVEIWESGLGKAGAFECVGTFKIEDRFTEDFIQYGNMTGCHGTGDFEGMKMNAYVTNENDPGTSTYQLWGEIW